MNKKRFVIGSALIAALLGIAPQSCVAQLKQDMLDKIKAALPEKAQVAAAQPRKALIYTRANGFVHSSIPYGAEALRLMGEKTGAYTSVVSDDPASFDPENLKQFDVVILVSTTQDMLLPTRDFNKLSEDQKKTAKENEAKYKQALLDFVTGGKGLMGLHAATDCYYNWADYGKMIGGYFDGHPWNAGDTVTIHNQDPKHPLNECFEGKETFDVKDEIYQLRNYSRNEQRVLLGLDVKKTNMNKGGVKRTDGDFAISWAKTFQKGRVFYCSLGHNEHIFWDSMILKHYLAGIQFAIGDLKADTTPLPLPEMTKIAWREFLDAPIPVNDAKDAVHGIYEGTFLTKKEAGVAPQPVTARVVAWGRDEWRAVVDVPEGDKTKRVEVPIKKAGNTFNIGGNAGGAEWTGKLENGKLSLSGGGEWELARTEKQSPTAGLKPPANATVLLPYVAGQAPKLDEWQNQNWRRAVDGSMQVNGGDQRTKREFGDIRLHLEYKPPLSPEARDQGRGNSGVYLQDRYEVQVLDSFGWPPADNQSGGIYKIAVPKINAALPPTEWQTYDMAFRAARFNADGTVKTPPTVTVYLNGQLIHDNVKLPGPTGGAAGNTHVAKGPLRLQDHGNPVRFRNIWVVEEKYPDDGPLPAPIEVK